MSAVQSFASPNARTPAKSSGTTPRTAESARRMRSSQRVGSVTNAAESSLREVGGKLEAILNFMASVEDGGSGASGSAALPSPTSPTTSPRRSPSGRRSPTTSASSPASLPDGGAELDEEQLKAASKGDLIDLVAALKRAVATKERVVQSQQSEIAALRKRVSILEAR